MFLQAAQQTAQFNTVPAPTGGINAYDSLAAMPATDAIALVNLIPQPYGCKVRGGSKHHATGLSGSVNSLATWPSTTGAIKLFAWSDDDFYEITSSGAVGAPLISGLANSWWQSINFANSAGTHMLAFSGTDNPIWYKTGGVSRLVLGDGIASGTIKNVNPLRFIQATVHQRRIWAVEIDSTLGWYFPTDSVYGEVHFFDFGPFFKLGGYLVALATWTVDSGAGSDDNLVAISSMGEAAVFAGTDVAVADKWRLIGVYNIGHPVRGRRFFANIAGDLYLLTDVGIVSMGTLVTSTTVNLATNTAYSKKIEFLLSSLTSDLGDLDGWELRFIPTHNLLLINVPSIYAEGNGQIVANTITAAWTTFRGFDAQTFIVVENELLFGRPDGKVVHALVGFKDDEHVDGTGGTDVHSMCQQAYSYLGAPAIQKQIGMFRPNFILTRKVGFNAKINYDFRRIPAAIPSGPPPGGFVSLWDEAIWGEDFWSGGAYSFLEWRQAEGIGVAASLSLALATSSEAVWVSTDYTFIKGGPL